ncbi:hypothetical protein HY732_01465 [Candidatus Uhrbacteria bacterium]|nr:hypothetical protein [Candidatus Uhrbacteria bacterium]
MNEIKIITEKISKEDLRGMSKIFFGDLVKAVVDCKKRIMAVGGELHSDEEQLLIERGSHQSDLWGINLYPEKDGVEWIEFDSMINIRPSQGNRSRGVENLEDQDIIRGVVNELTE